MKLKKPRVFFFHYNKPASRVENKPKLTVHYLGICHIVDHIICDVKTFTKHNKHQPHVVIKGKSSNILFKIDSETNQKIAYIT